MKITKLWNKINAQNNPSKGPDQTPLRLCVNRVNAIKTEQQQSSDCAFATSK